MFSYTWFEYMVNTSNVGDITINLRNGHCNMLQKMAL